MKPEIAERYFLQEQYNCAEAVLLTANETWGLGLDLEDAKLVAAFGGGMGCGKTCGALAGALAALGKLRVQGNAHNTKGFREDCAALTAAFEERLGGTDCSVVKPRFFEKQRRCIAVVQVALEALEAQCPPEK